MAPYGHFPDDPMSNEYRRIDVNGRPTIGTTGEDRHNGIGRRAVGG